MPSLAPYLVTFARRSAKSSPRKTNNPRGRLPLPTSSVLGKMARAMTCAVSVLPTPVGPVNAKTKGRGWSFINVISQ